MNGLVVQMCWEQQQPDIIIPSMLGWEGLVGENHHNMTSYSLTILYVFLCGSYSFFFGSDCWMPLLPCFFQSLWEVSLFKMSLFEKGLTLKLYLCPMKRFYFFFYKRLCSHPFLCISATVSPGWATALPLIGVRLTCLWAKPSCWASLFNL